MTEEQKKKIKTAVVDATLHKIVSRKLLVWGTATVALFVGPVDASSWIDVCMIYIGGQTVVDTVVALRSTKNDG